MKHVSVATLTAAFFVATSAAANPNAGLEIMTRHKLAAADAEALIAIVNCESGFRQYDQNGNLLRNQTVKDVVGIMQLHSRFHPAPEVIAAFNRRHGTTYSVGDFNIKNPEGNVDYGIILFKVQGLRPWSQCVE